MASENVRELRFISKELRVAAGDSPKLVGLAARFNSPAQIGDSFIETILPGAFTATLADRSNNIRALYNHNADHVLGSTKSGTLKLWESSVGLQFECLLPDTSVARDVYALVQRQDVSQCSFGFTVDAENWIPSTNGGLPTRELQSVSCFDVTIACTFPAYKNTSVEARSAMFPAGTAYVDRSAAKAAALSTLPELYVSDEELSQIHRRAINLGKI
jgi:uncharacterized protein